MLQYAASPFSTMNIMIDTHIMLTDLELQNLAGYLFRRRTAHKHTKCMCHTHSNIHTQSLMKPKTNIAELCSTANRSTGR